MLYTKKITDFLLELGKGFVFVSREYALLKWTAPTTKLLCFFVTPFCTLIVDIELKVGEFLPEYVSKLNFYINAIDDKLQTPTDEPPVGLLLCASKSNVKVEYAMRGLTKPLGVGS